MCSEKLSGIYRIRNIKNGKCYIGSSVDVYRRWGSHKSLLRRGKHHSVHLQNAWNKYGEEFFTFEILTLCPKNKTEEFEQFYLDGFNCEYNVAKSAATSWLGLHHSQKSKEKMSKAKSGKNHPNYGKHLSKTTKQKMQIRAKHNPRCQKGVTIPTTEILKRVGEKCGASILKEEQVLDMRRKYKLLKHGEKYNFYDKMAMEYGVHRQTILQAILGTTWKYIETED